MRERLAGLGRRLVAYAVMLVAVIVLLRILIGSVIGFFHMLVFIAVALFAIYAFFWARGLKNRA